MKQHPFFFHVDLYIIWHFYAMLKQQLAQKWNISENVHVM